MKRTVSCRVVLVLAGALAACADPIVGAECRAGFAVCEGVCVDLERDPSHCGQCGTVCDLGTETCSAGRCVAFEGDAGMDAGADASLDGMVGDAAADAGADATTADAGVGADGGPLGCPLGQQVCVDECIDPLTDERHCGDCGNACRVGRVCSDGTCANRCEPPTTMCGRTCVDLQTHASHCGECDNPCGNDICVDGECTDALAGHAVVIGHDFESSNGVMQNIAGDAVFLDRSAPVEVLAFEGTSTTVAAIDEAIDRVAVDKGRSWTKTMAIEGLVTFQLADARVFLVYPQPAMADDELADLGARWATALSDFLNVGGVVVLFDGPGDNGGTFQVLEAAGIFSADGHEGANGQTLTVVARGDAIALGASGTYAAAANTVRFIGQDTPGVVVVVDEQDRPVIVHRVVAP